MWTGYLKTCRKSTSPSTWQRTGVTCCLTREVKLFHQNFLFLCVCVVMLLRLRSESEVYPLGYLEQRCCQWTCCTARIVIHEGGQRFWCLSMSGISWLSVWSHFLYISSRVLNNNNNNIGHLSRPFSREPVALTIQMKHKCTHTHT